MDDKKLEALNRQLMEEGQTLVSDDPRFEEGGENIELSNENVETVSGK